MIRPRQTSEEKENILKRVESNRREQNDSASRLTRVQYKERVVKSKKGRTLTSAERILSEESNSIQEGGNIRYHLVTRRKEISCSNEKGTVVP